MVTAPLMMPPAELESAAFCSASKRSIQLSYEGLGLTVGILYRSARQSSSALIIFFELQYMQQDSNGMFDFRFHDQIHDAML